MNKQKLTIFSILGFYTVIQLVAYIYAVFIGTSGINYLIDYGSITLNFIMAVILFLFLKKKDSLIVLIALEFTLLADTGLILLEEVEAVSVFFFFFVQLFYALRVRQYSVKLSLKWDIILRLGFLVLLELAAYFLFRENFTWLVGVTLLYFTNFVFNFILAIINTRQNILFAIGLFLFLLCDISLGLRMLDEFMNVTNWSIIQMIIACPIDLVWMFYFPSQVFIVLSIKYNRMVNEENYDKNFRIITDNNDKTDEL